VARVFITGSSDGLGLMTARLLIDQGHEVVLHGRSEGRSLEITLHGGKRRKVLWQHAPLTAGSRDIQDRIQHGP
jgi:NAD(P)-dependent dehydrogenase (short-subunit alcohol dehydrogenase family)